MRAPDSPIYLDYNGTTPLAPEVVAAMLPYLERHFGNPSSGHPYGRAARSGVVRARAQVAALLGCSFDEVLFTSGGTESDNHALRGVAEAFEGERVHLVISGVEHPAILEPALWLEERGVELTILPVDGYGLVDPDELRRALRPHTRLVSVMLANNEVGTLQPVAELARVAHEGGALLHTDAAQAVGKVPIDFAGLGADLLTVAGHKLYAPKGVGALLIRRGLELPRLMHGAGQERGLRAGTENVAHVVGLGAACELAAEDLGEESERLRGLRDLLHRRLTEGLGDDRVRLNGHPERRLPNTLNLSIAGIVSGELVPALAERVAVSAGAACHSGGVKVSLVLHAMGVPGEWARGAVRFSLGRYSTEQQVLEAADIVVAQVRAQVS